MGQLLLFLYRLRFFLLFVVLEVIAAWLIVSRNSYQGVAFLSSSNQLAGGVYNFTSGFTGYFDLQSRNQELMRQNARLLEQLQSAGYNDSTVADSLQQGVDQVYRVVPARVINNSVLLNENYLTLNKGSRHGIKRGMGVISSEGIVGHVKEVSANFSTVYSLLHSDVRVSSQIRRLKTLCTVKWNTESSVNDYLTASVLYLPFHVPVQLGDTVETSGYNAVYPEGIDIGVVNRVYTDTTRNFLTVDVQLSTDFSQIKDVYVLGDSLRPEKAAVEELTRQEP